MDKDSKKSNKTEERTKKELLFIDNMKEIDAKFKEIKIKKENLLENFTTCFKNICEYGNQKIKTPEVLEELYLTTGRMVEFSLLEKDLNFQDKLNDEEKSYLIRFFYTTYERFTTKKNTLTLKPAKIYNAHYNLINKNGIGSVHRALFSIQK